MARRDGQVAALDETLIWATAGDLARALNAEELSAADLVASLLKRSDVVGDATGAFLHRTDERALEAARAADERRSAGRSLSRFDGVPVSFKDIFTTRGVPTTCGSRILEGWVPPFDSTVVARCAEAGLPMHGKLNMDEFAMGSSTENSGYGPARNPWDLDRVPGGSSGGAAALVAAGGTPWAWGTDTGGSVRQPASLCGIVGLKPTYGRVSRYGMIAFASSLDQAGPLTRSVADAAALLSLAAGHDPMDSTSIPQGPEDYLEGIDAGVSGMRIGVIQQFGGAGVQAGVRTKIDEAYGRLEKLGARIGEVSLPSLDHAVPAYYLIAPAEASSNLARYDGVRYGHRYRDADDIVEMMSKTRATGFGAEVKRRIMIGTYALSAGFYDAYYGNAQKVRTLITRDLSRAYEDFDLLVCPTSPTTAFRAGERIDDPLTMYYSDVFTVPMNLAGTPAVSVPCGSSPEDGMPVGLQISAPALEEKRLLRAAYAFEQDLGWSSSAEARPPL